ncbi:SRPBCC family protein [Halosimplex salinum]|uniref:SRPBCC family protein n=1 Tax=Halosimplex salinum TaxID=1710538 RepID=UPI000F46327E|nr:SRPBCC family protein [Halosimplex salinum]
MDEVEVSTVVYVSPAEAYDFLVDFPRYADYSKYLKEVRRDGDGSAGTRYALQFSWWKLSYTAHTEVVDTERPNRIDWRVTEDIDADGYWNVTEVPDEAPPEAETASEVSLRIEYDPGSVSAGSIDLPRFISLSRVIDKVKPLIQNEAERVVERIVTDLEGTHREVELTIHTRPDAV